jgi:DNA invertase Pin-like site-specific DNA recombinase
MLGNKRLKVVFADSPHASQLENGIRAVFAEEEGRAISARTKAALAQAKKRGVKLGNYDGGRGLVAHTAKYGNVAGCDGARKHANEFANEMREIIKEIIDDDGLKDSAEIAARLNKRKIESRRGKCWHETSVRRLRARLAI